MITKANKELAKWTQDFALKNGCEAARVVLYNGESNTVEIRDRKIDRLHQAAENNLIIQIFTKGRSGNYSTNRLDRKEIEKLLLDGIAATGYLAEDRARALPDASRYYQGGGKDLQLMDPDFDKVNPDEKVALAQQVCEEMMGKDERIISATSSYNDTKQYKYMIASNGFEGGIGAKALERVLRKIGQKKAASGKYTMVVDNMNSAQLLSPILGAIDGSAIQQRNSFLLDKLGQKVLGSNVTLLDEPHLVKASGARYFDNEGVATKRQPIFQDGVLKTYFIDTYRANKMQVEPTISSPSVLVMQTGTKDLEGLIAGVEKGIWVTGFNGGNCNSTTGDFSYGIEGFLIEKGKVVRPVSEMNVTGNMLTLWQNVVETGNDPRVSSSWRIPSVVFEDVAFSGL